MYNSRSFAKLLALFMLLAVLLTACGQAESDLSVSEPWARAATADTMAMDDEGDMADMSEDDSDMSEDMAMADEEDDMAAMDTEEATSDDDSEMAEDMDMSGDEGGMAMHSGGGVSAVYMTIENQGGAADTLVSAETAVAAVVEIHETQMDEEGVMRMRPLSDGLEIPANGSASLEPGGYHIMLMQLQQDLVAGETISLTLTFSSGKTLTVEAEVRNP